jgi:hypothetical protein
MILNEDELGFDYDHGYFSRSLVVFSQEEGYTSSVLDSDGVPYKIAPQLNKIGFRLTNDQ